MLTLFLTTIYGLYFNHHYTYTQINFMSGPLCAAQVLLFWWLSWIYSPLGQALLLVPVQGVSLFKCLFFMIIQPCIRVMWIQNVNVPLPRWDLNPGPSKCQWATVLVKTVFHVFASFSSFQRKTAWKIGECLLNCKNYARRRFVKKASKVWNNYVKLPFHLKKCVCGNLMATF